MRDPEAAGALKTAGSLSSADPETVVRDLLALPLREFALTCRRAHRQLMGANARASAETIVIAVRALTPVALDEGLVQVAVQFAAGCLIELPVATPPLAEVLVAAADRRDLRPRAPKLAKDLMRGEGDLNHAVEGGKGRSASVDLIRQHLISQHVDAWLLQGADEKEKDRLVCRALERLASGDLGDGPFRHFFIYERSGASGQRSASQLIAGDLNARFPQIRTLALNLNPDPDDKDKELFVNDLLVDLFLSHDQRKDPADRR